MLACSKTCFGTGGINRCINNDGVTCCGNYFLSNLVLTSCTMLACSKTCFGTGGLNFCINNDVVVECINNILFYSCIVTSCAVLTLGKTGVKTVSLNRLVNNDVVTKCSYNLVMTYCTFLSCCTGCLSTGSMIELCDLFLCYGNRITYRTLLTVGKTALCTAGRLACKCFFCVTKSRTLGFATFRAGLGSYTCSIRPSVLMTAGNYSGGEQVA